MDKETKICEMYKNGKKVKEIIEECRCSTNTIQKVIKKYNIPKRQVKNIDKDLSKFYLIDNEVTQYWLGYICADGTIQYDTNKGVYSVSLYSKEIEVIDKYRNYFGKDIVKVNKSSNGIYKAYVNSKKLCEFFIQKLNITPNKSLNLNPNIKYTNHFIRGYFDGDGCIMNSKPNRIRYEVNITSGDYNFLSKIKNILDQEDIYSILYKHTDCNAYKIRIDRKIDSEKLYKFLYKGATVFLSRKLNNFVALYGDIYMIKSDELGESPEVDNSELSMRLTSHESVTTNS